MKKYVFLIVIILSNCFGINNCITPELPSLEEMDFLHKKQVEIGNQITQKFKEKASLDEIRKVAEEEIESFWESSKHESPIMGPFYGYYFYPYIESIEHFLKNDDVNLEAWEKFYCFNEERLLIFNKGKQTFDETIEKWYRKERFQKKAFKKCATSSIPECIVWREHQLIATGIIQSDLGYNKEYWYYTGRLLSILTFKGYTDEQRDELFFEMYPQLKELEDTKELYKPQTCCVIM